MAIILGGDKQRTELVQMCDRCGETHVLKFTSLTYHLDSNPLRRIKWWAMCPNAKQPIMMAFEEHKVPGLQ